MQLLHFVRAGLHIESGNILTSPGDQLVHRFVVAKKYIAAAQSRKQVGTARPKQRVNEYWALRHRPAPKV